MANLWSTLFGRSKEERFDPTLSMDQWASYFNFNGVNYPIRIGSSTSGLSEPIGSDFQGYADGAFKGNSIVFSCCVARQMVFAEARFIWQPVRQGRPQEDVYGDTDLDILETPWPNGTTGDLLARAIQDVDMAGNHYVVREGKRLRRLRPDWVDIILTKDPTLAVESDVAGYVYKPGGTEDRKKWAIYPIDGSNGKVAHWAPIPDPTAMYRGVSWITPVIREIQADTAATRHKMKFFENAATPNIAVSFKETVTEDQFKEFVSAMEDSHSGVDNAYSTLYLGGGADVTPLTHDMAQLDFKRTQGAGETRIAAAAGVHPVVVGLSEGMQGSSLNAGNFKSAIKAFGDIRMRPMWRTLCAAYSTLLTVPKDARLWYDDKDIAFLQDDEQARVKVASEEATIITKLVQDGYTPESIIVALKKRDWSLLKHTGLFSVQLQPPLPDQPDYGAPKATAAGTPAKQNPNTPPNLAKGRPAGGQNGKPAGGTTGAKPTPLQNQQKAAAAKKAAAPKKPTT